MKIDLSKLAKKLKSRFASKQSVLKRYPAEMGDGRGNLEVSRMDGFVYVRINDKVVPVFNNRVANQAGTAVWVGYAPENETLLQVLSTRSDSPTGAETGYVGFAPAKRYEWHAPRGGQDPLAVHLRAITPLKLSVSDTVPTPGELLVNLYRGFVYSGSRYYAIQRQDIDVAAHVPSTTGKAAFVMVTISNTGTIVQTKGAEVDIDALAITDIPEIPAGTVFVCGAVRVYNGQEKVKEGRTNTDFVDLRFTSAYGFDTSGAFLLDPDPLMAADSDEVAPTQAAVIDYVAAEIPAQGADYFVRKWLKLTDPTVTDDDTEGYLVTDEWFVTSTQRLYKCKDNATGAAVWTLEGIGGADLQWVIDGPLAVADPCDVPILITKPTTLTALYIYGEDLGSAGNTTVDVDLNGGGTILSAPISLAWNDANGWAMVVPVTVDLVEGDILTPSTTGVATGAAGLRIIMQAESEAGAGGDFNLTLEDGDAGVSVSNVAKIVVPTDRLINLGGNEAEIDFTNIRAVTFAGSTTTSGQNQNRTSGGTYTAHRAYITLHRPIKLDSVKWDVSSAKTYTVKIYRGWQITTALLDLSTQVAAGRTAEVTWDAADAFLPAGHYVIELTWSGAAVVDDNTVNSSTSTPNMFDFFQIERTQYDTTFDTDYSAAIKLVAYLGTDVIL